MRGSGLWTVERLLPGPIDRPRDVALIATEQRFKFRVVWPPDVGRQGLPLSGQPIQLSVLIPAEKGRHTHEGIKCLGVQDIEARAVLHSANPVSVEIVERRQHRQGSHRLRMDVWGGRHGNFDAKIGSDGRVSHDAEQKL
jgi:hypothetical protein